MGSSPAAAQGHVPVPSDAPVKPTAESSVPPLPDLPDDPTDELPSTSSATGPSQINAPEPAAPRHGLMRQQTVAEIFQAARPYDPNSARAQTINHAVAEFIVNDMRPLSVVEGQGFKNLCKTLDGRYKVPSRPHILEKSIVPMFHLTKVEVEKDLSKAVSHSFTTDAWTSPQNDSFTTTTVHYLDYTTLDLKSNVLETLPCDKRHTAENLKEEMKSMLSD